MLQQQTSCEQTNALDVTIQFNVKPNNVSSMTAKFSNDAYQPNNQSIHSYPLFNSFAPGSCLQMTHPCAPALPFLPGHDGMCTTAPYLPTSGLGTNSMQTNLQNARNNIGINHPSSNNATQNGIRYPGAPSFAPTDFYQSPSPALKTNSQFFMTNNGYGPPSKYCINQSVLHPLQDAASVSQLETNVQDLANQQDLVKVPTIGQVEDTENVSDQSSPYSLPQCQFSATNATAKVSREPPSQGSPDSHSSLSSDDQYEDTKLAMRERDVRYRLELLKSKNCKEADDLETLQQTQTTKIDHERHTMLAQMACNKSSTDYINAHYNRKLLDLLETIEQKLTTLEKVPKVEETKRTIVTKPMPVAPKRSTVVPIRRGLPKKARKLLEDWYSENLANPYPSSELSRELAEQGCIRLEQVRKWFANKRNRSKNNKEKMRESLEQVKEPAEPEDLLSPVESPTSTEMLYSQTLLTPPEQTTLTLMP